MTRQRHFRGLKIKLECGYVAVAATSFYRLSRDRQAAIGSALVRRGVWCFECNATCQPIRSLGTVRLK